MVGAAGAWHLLRGRDNPAVRKMLSMALWMALLVAPVQAFIGDMHGLNTLKHQPAKIAAIEGHWEQPAPGDGAPLLLFGIPEMQAEETRYALEIPHLGSLILTHTWDGKVPSLNEFSPQDRPNATIVFWTFRVMVGLGILMILLGLWGLWLRRGQRLYRHRGFLRFALCMGPAGLAAVLAGWMTTEIGRQPWIVYGVMRTADAVSPIGAGQLGFTLALFVVVYFLVFGAGVAYMMKLIRVGPRIGEEATTPEGGPGQERHPMRPISAAPRESELPAAAPASGN
jgi:cytochrome d ubiquinol oxidase subunit I